MRVFETQLPGVGDRFTVEFEGGGELVVVIHNEGNQDVYWRPHPDDEKERLFEATERQARTIAEIFDGSYFEPVDETFENALQDAAVEWVEVAANAPVAGRTIGEADIRSETGATVLAIRRSRQTFSNPDAGFGIEAGDVLVVVGDDEAHDALERLLAG
ncbi:cation:proton antiporter regulatory subunit [Halobium salinum]|uniref:Cation:proton antiporter regulatory subunit n=1 Tax=Halobium salinum TaxID=1364940 RepID=A0ABD5PCE5_9EURY|nr:TrkA C-terminal domain-containing protein [Halobium salinum]